LLYHISDRARVEEKLSLLVEAKQKENNEIQQHAKDELNDVKRQMETVSKEYSQLESIVDILRREIRAYKVMYGIILHKL
jgi:hypothetical protein